MTQVLKHKKLSPKLNKILNNISGVFGKLNAQVDLAFKVGKDEGFSEKEIADLVRQKMKEAGYGYTRIWQVLKENHPDVIGKQGRKNFHKLKVSGTKENKFDALGLSAQALGYNPLRTKTNEDQHEDLIWQIDPKDYSVLDLKHYDHAMKDRIIEYLAQEVKKLKIRLAELELKMKSQSWRKAK
jgi:hypothetical protein